MKVLLINPSSGIRRRHARGAVKLERCEDLNSPLLMGSANGRRDVVSDALSRGVSPNFQDKNGDTPLIWVGASIDLKGEGGNTALMMAVKYGRDDTVMLLLEKGAKR
jgi:ankyrin repeat protein